MPGEADAHALLHALFVVKADAARAAVDHHHGLPVIRAQPFRLPESPRDAGPAVRRAPVGEPVAVGRRDDPIGTLAGVVAGRALAGGRVCLGGKGGAETPQVGLVGAAGSVRALRAARVTGRRGLAAEIDAGGGQRRQKRERQDGRGTSARQIGRASCRERVSFVV